MPSEIFSPLDLHSSWSIQSPAADANEHTACSHPIKTSNTNPCLVCGGEGRCVNYGGFTCLACRAFFRRHGLRPKVERCEVTSNHCDLSFAQRIPKCPWNGQCEVNVNIQKQPSCIACRLSKCFSVGMSANFIPKETAKSRRGRPVSRKVESQEVVVHPSEEVCGNTAMYEAIFQLISVFSRI